MFHIVFPLCGYFYRLYLLSLLLLKVNEILDTNMFDVNCCDDKQRTCLHIASSRGYLEIVRALLNYGANPNLRDCVDNMAIHLAIIASHVPVVTVLLEAGTDINSIANASNGKTVLHLAGTRLRWLLNDENNKASAKLKVEAIMVSAMILAFLLLRFLCLIVNLHANEQQKHDFRL